MSKRNQLHKLILLARIKINKKNLLYILFIIFYSLFYVRNNYVIPEKYSIKTSLNYIIYNNLYNNNNKTLSKLYIKHHFHIVININMY